MKHNWQFSIFFSEIVAFFLEVIKSHKLKFSVILSIGLPCKTFVVTDIIVVSILVDIFMLFTSSEKVHFFTEISPWVIIMCSSKHFE